MGKDIERSGPQNDLAAPLGEVEQVGGTPMSSKELTPSSAAEAAIAPYLAGGLIEGAVGGLERSMVTLVQSHLTEVALLQAKGDIAPERPFYIFNPDTGLLINYAYRHDKDPARTGLFADVVELDADGKPRYGVSELINPFSTQSGFVNVTVGENPYGFTPDNIDLKSDPEDPTKAIPPNIATANLLAMLGQDAVSQDETIEGFIQRREKERAKFRAKAIQYQSRSYPPNSQAITEYTNSDLHLIISDREDTTAIANASRSVGLYPLIVTGDEVLEHLESSSIAVNPHSKEWASPELGIYLFKLLHGTFPNLHDWLKNNEPAFLTIDLPRAAMRNPDGSERYVTLRTVKADMSPDSDTMGNAREGKPETLPRSDTLDLFVQDMARRSPVFAQVQNNRFREGTDGYTDDGKVVKLGPGSYLHIPVDENPENLVQYTDWLRKVKLDLTMTMYLRGLNQL